MIWNSAVSGGAPLSKEVAEFFDAMDILILEGWGATEATTPSTFNSPYDYRFGTVGRPLPGVEVRVAPDGELEVKGPNVFKEYWRNPEETNATFTPDGFYRTGDIGEINEEGRVIITDRKKELIITSGGKNIAPAPIENLLLGGRHIEMAYVHGDRRHYLTALLVPGSKCRQGNGRIQRHQRLLLAGIDSSSPDYGKGAERGGPGKRSASPVYADQVFPYPSKALFHRRR